jgi:tRNA threonylcarbamoyladenosine biosynthesis protein TsaB
MLLAIDTATRLMSLALHDGQELLAEESWHTDNNHTAELAPAIRQLLFRGQASVDDLTALAVSTGPGSFTGLRIGIALAKGMASARGLPLVGVSTLDTLAAAQPQYPRHALIAVVEAGRGRIIAATYRWGPGYWVHRGEPRLMDWETLLESIDGPAYVTGTIDDEGRQSFEKAQAADVPVKLVSPALRLRRAGFLAETALQRLRDHPEDHNPSLLVPLYVKTRDIPQQA